VGAVTLDRFGSEWRPGGAPLYAARALAALGLRARVLAIAGPGADLEALSGHELEVVDAEASLRFEHEPAGESRRLRLVVRPERALTARDLPPGWGDAEVLVLAPLLPDDLDVVSFGGVGSGLVGLLAQGLQRRVAPDGVVSLAGEPSEALCTALGAGHARTTVFLSSEEVAGWPREALPALASSCARVVVTRGAAGAEVHRAGEAPLAVAAAPADARDTTGGGDAFAAAFMAALAGGAGDAGAGALAARLAAATVARVGPAELPAVALQGSGVEVGDAVVAQ